MHLDDMPSELHLIIAGFLTKLKNFGRTSKYYHKIAATISLYRATSSNAGMLSTDFPWYIPILAKNHPHELVNRFILEIVVHEINASKDGASEVGHYLSLFERIPRQKTFCEIPSEVVYSLFKSVRTRLEEDTKIIKVKHLIRSVLLLRSLFPIPDGSFAQALAFIRDRALKNLEKTTRTAQITVIVAVCLVKCLPESLEAVNEIESALRNSITQRLKRGSVWVTCLFFQTVDKLIYVGLIKNEFWGSLHIAICDRIMMEFEKGKCIDNVKDLLKHGWFWPQFSPKEDFGESITKIQQQVKSNLARDQKNAIAWLRLIKQASETITYLSKVFPKVTEGMEVQVYLDESAARITRPQEKTKSEITLSTLVEELRGLMSEAIVDQDPWFLEKEDGKHHAFGGR